MDNDDDLLIVKHISDDIEAICIVDFIDAEKSSLLDENFKKLTGNTITFEGTHYPWVPVEYSNGTIILNQKNGIPNELEQINVIWVKHIGVAHEIIFIGKLNREVEKSDVQRYFEDDLNKKIVSIFRNRYLTQSSDLSSLEKFEIETEKIVSDYITGKSIESLEGKLLFSELKTSVQDTEVELPRNQLDSDYLRARLKYFNNIQKKVEVYAKTIVSGTFLNRATHYGGNKCISIWIYDASKYNPMGENKFGVHTPIYSKVIQWIRTFERKSTPQDEKYNDLSFLGFDTKNFDETPISIIETKFIIGHGNEVMPDEMGAYTNRYIIFRFEKDSDFFTLDSANFKSVLTDITKSLLPLHWIRIRTSELEPFESIADDFENPVLNDISSKDIIKNLHNIWSSYNKNNKLIKKNKTFFEKIETELLYLKSLRESFVTIVGEQENKTMLIVCPNISTRITIDTDFWMHKLSNRLDKIRLKEEEHVRYIHDHINIYSSYLNVNLQNSIEKYTLWVLAFTVAIFICTITPFLINFIYPLMEFVWRFILSTFLEQYNNLIINFKGK